MTKTLSFYHSRNIDVDVRTATIINDAEILLDRCQGQYGPCERASDCCCGVWKSRPLLMIMENAGCASKEKNHRNRHLFKTRQTRRRPSAPRPEKHIGYAANIVEAVSDGGSVIVDYQYEQNIYSDSRFLGAHLDHLPPQETPAFIVMDGAYSGQMHRDAAAEKNVTLINTSREKHTGPGYLCRFQDQRGWRTDFAVPCLP